MGLGGVVRSVDAILGERDRVVGLRGHGPELHGDPEAGEEGHVLPIEIRDGLGTQGYVANGAVARLHDQSVVDEVEVDVEGAGAGGDRRRGQSARGDVERHVPPVILPGR